MSVGAGREIYAAMEGGELGKASNEFFAELRAATDAMGYPCFLRTGQTSHKHRWSETCYLRFADELKGHVGQLVEFSSICDFIGLPFNVWAVREFLPISPLATCPRYKGMPVNIEWRFFVRGGQVVCQHPYWPHKSLVEGGLTEKNAKLIELAYEDAYDQRPRDLAASAGKAIGGDWSIDVLWTDNGWHITDCAEAARSWHWPDCQMAKEFSK